jgi:hypothetical protein
MNTIRDRIPIETLLRQYIDETQEIETTKVEKIVERPVKADTNVRAEPSVKAEPSVRVEPKADVKMEPMSDVMEEPKIATFAPDSFDDKSNSNTNSMFNVSNFKSFNAETEPRIKFAENNSVLTFDSPVEPISLGEITPIEDFEVLDLSTNTEKINIDFEEL